MLKQLRKKNNDFDYNVGESKEQKNILRACDLNDNFTRTHRSSLLMKDIRLNKLW